MKKNLSPQDYRNRHKKCSFCIYGYRPPDALMNDMVLCCVKDKFKHPNVLRLCRYYQAKKIEEYYS